MLTLTPTGIAGLTCGRCREPVPMDSAVMLKHDDLSSVNIACIDCAEKIKEGFPKMQVILAREFFESLLVTGRPRRVQIAGS
jgi:hypothetical protein